MERAGGFVCSVRFFSRCEPVGDKLVPVHQCRPNGWVLWFDRTVIMAPAEVLGSSEGAVGAGESAWMTDRFHGHGRRVSE